MAEWEASDFLSHIDTPIRMDQVPLWKIQTLLEGLPHRLKPIGETRHLCTKISPPPQHHTIRSKPPQPTLLSPSREGKDLGCKSKILIFCRAAWGTGFCHAWVWALVGRCSDGEPLRENTGEDLDKYALTGHRPLPTSAPSRWSTTQILALCAGKELEHSPGIRGSYPKNWLLLEMLFWSSPSPK